MVKGSESDLRGFERWSRRDTIKFRGFRMCWLKVPLRFLTSRGYGFRALFFLAMALKGFYSDLGFRGSLQG